MVDDDDSFFTLTFFYKQIFLLVDLLCCGAVLFPVIW